MNEFSNITYSTNNVNRIIQYKMNNILELRAKVNMWRSVIMIIYCNSYYIYGKIEIVFFL